MSDAASFAPRVGQRVRVLREGSPLNGRLGVVRNATCVLVIVHLFPTRAEPEPPWRYFDLHEVEVWPG